MLIAATAEPDAPPPLDALYRAHVVTARRLALLMTGDLALAEDLAHDAFVRAAAKLGTLRDVSAFDTSSARS